MRPTAKHDIRESKVLFAVFLIVAILFFGCSSRIVYDEPPKYATTANTININTASVDEIEKLPHIGRKTAEAIIAFRQENGPFRRPEHLLLIRGISEKRFSDIRQFLRTE